MAPWTPDLIGLVLGDCVGQVRIYLDLWGGFWGKGPGLMSLCGASAVVSGFVRVFGWWEDLWEGGFFLEKVSLLEGCVAGVAGVAGVADFLR